jgi:molybdopterin molybdotransferase
MKMRPFGRLLPMGRARDRLLRTVRAIQRREWLPLESAAGRISAATVRAPRNVPDFRRATWDGYALRASATAGASQKHPAEFRIVGEVFAEQTFHGTVGAREAVAIATGGALPRGTDTVLLFEEAHVRGRKLRVTHPLRALERIAEPGEDFARGEVLVRSGDPLTPAALGSLAAVGLRRVRAWARPRVSIVPNGNELVARGGSLRPGQIFESNNLTVGALVEACGCDPIPSPPVRDDPRAIETALRRALRTSDLVLVTGGSSVGERDYLPSVFPRIGKLLFHGVAVRPGKPTLATLARGKLVVGLPGHPTSCLSNGFWLLLPLLRKLARLPGPGGWEEQVRLGASVEGFGGGFSTIVPFRVSEGIAYPTFHGSSAISSLRGTNGFLVLPPRPQRLPRGSAVTVHRLPAPIGAE